MATNSPVRGKLIQVLHTGKTARVWDDETYRVVLARLTGGKTSSKSCSLDELRRVLEHMHDSGCARRHGRRPRVAIRRQDALAKIEALLADTGRPRAYAESMARHMFSGRQAIEWLDSDELQKLMQALIIDQQRRAHRAGTQEERQMKNAADLENVRDLLSYAVLELIELIGYRDTLVLIDRLGGITFPVGKDVRQRSNRRADVLAGIIPPEAVKAIVARFGGDYLDVPRCASALQELRNQRFLSEYHALLAAGVSGRFALMTLCPLLRVQ